jgi:peptide/nickel transport system permease protein
LYRFVVRRLLLAALTMFIVSIVTFFMLRLIPGDIIDLMLADFGYAADRGLLETQLGLNLPLYTQFSNWFFGLLTGDLGDSLWTGRTVAEELSVRYPVTIELAAIALISSVVISIPVGIITAVRQDTWVDYILRSTSIGFVAVPVLWIGTLVITVPAILWGWSPPLSYVPFADNPLKNLSVMLLPGLIIGVPLIGGVIRMTRAMMLEVVRQDYIRTAWAKGLRPRTIWYRHAVRNAMIPVLSLLGLQIPFLLGGTVVIEQIFNLPGMGQYMLSSLQHRDYVPAQTIVLIFAAGTVLINLIVDLLYSYLDPRIRYA